MYQKSVSLAYALVIVANIPSFLYRLGVYPLPPWTVLLAFGGLALPCIGFHRNSLPSLGLLKWSYGFLVLCALSAIIGSTFVGWGSILARTSFVVSIVVGVVLFSNREAVMSAMVGACGATILMVTANFWELLSPGVYGEVSRRPTGLFDNPNISGTSIVFAMILGSRAVPVQWRPLFHLFAGVGVLTTFSRGAIIAWLAASVLMNVLPATREISAKRAFGWVSLGALLIVFVLSSAWQQIEDWSAENIDERNIQRLLTLGSQGVIEDDPRSNLALAYWKLYQDRPLTGYGLGASDGRLVDSGSGPHNMFLALLIEHGLIGVVVVPSLLALLLYRSDRITIGVLLPLCVLIVTASLVSHTLLTQWGYGAGVAMAVGYGRWFGDWPFSENRLMEKAQMHQHTNARLSRSAAL